MDRAATQHAAISKTDTKRTYTHKCGRCRTVLEYDTHADWPTISLLVNEHYFACPVKFDFRRGPALSHPSSEPDDAQSPIYDSSENVDAADGKQDEPLIQVAGSSKQRKNEAQRKQELEDDKYTYDVRPTSVICRGCDREISLDKRSRYYPGLWMKHRGKCARIYKIENEKLARSGDGFCPSNTEQRPTAASLFELDNPRTDGISRTANSVEDNTLRSMELSDDEGPEEENQDHIPFAGKSVLDGIKHDVHHEP
ncbi:uncharacterized protein F5891DRAFT_548217 [Suillus fuscotomentosus]|uniref:Uncharacterized protein n=1 Tax=Suillus fuscotomentosus TaxID=1912939 RepID=A0AAD4E298_9AGAM|nr:uncharacterized protein F5891DRAFT_548217 [Suillus fuscotomentosus]KAG1897154.1 hypothetical protein F5891DRAFT_548217 [Suillus fuscotomentosus]